MTDALLQHTQPLTLSELEATVGGMPAPAWWWLAMFLVSESQGLVDGIRDGYNAT